MPSVPAVVQPASRSTRPPDPARGGQLTFDQPPAPPVPRPGSRLARAKMPRAKDVVRDLAVEIGVCVRPLPLRRAPTPLQGKRR
jgi:hypothetical protein